MMNGFIQMSLLDYITHILTVLSMQPRWTPLSQLSLNAEIM